MEVLQRVLINAIHVGAWSLFLLVLVLSVPSSRADDSQLLTAGVQAFVAGDNRAAAQKLRQLLETYPDSRLRELALLHLSRAQRREGNRQEAAQAIAQLLRGNPDTSSAAEARKEILTLLSHPNNGEENPDDGDEIQLAPLPTGELAGISQASESQELRQDERQAEEVRSVRQKAEEARLAQEKAERERLARERAERERLAAEKAAQERAEHERLARQKAEEERLALENAEKERLAHERADKESLVALHGLIRGAPEGGVSTGAQTTDTAALNSPHPVRRAGHGSAPIAALDFTVNLPGKPHRPASTVVTSAPLLRAVLKPDKTEVHPGERIDYTVTLVNVGSAKAEGVSMWLKYPDAEYDADEYARAGFRNEGGGTLVLDGVGIEPGQALDFPVVFRVRNDVGANRELRCSVKLLNGATGSWDSFRSKASFVKPASVGVGPGAKLH